MPAGPAGVRQARSPMPVTAVIDVDYRVPGCPIDMGEFVHVLSRALQGLTDNPTSFADDEFEVAVAIAPRRSVAAMT